MAESPKCSTCPYWVRDTKPDVGNCQRFPPVPLQDGNRQTFVRTEGDEWCGEHPESLSRIKSEKAAELIKATQNIRR